MRSQRQNVEKCNRVNPQFLRVLTLVSSPHPTGDFPFLQADGIAVDRGGRSVAAECAKCVPKREKAPSVRIGAFCNIVSFQIDDWLRGEDLNL